MKASERAYRIGRDFAGVLPRAHAALRSSGDWKPLSPIGARQLGEVMLDELALSGMTLTAPPPKLERSLESCEAAAEELSALGVERAHTDPEPLRVKSIRRRRLGRLVYERLKFEHEPVLPRSLAADGLGGPATAVAHLCRTGDDRRPWLVWVHGAGQGQPIDLLFARARRIRDDLGFNIALPIQPGHGSRRTAWPPYPEHGPADQRRRDDARRLGGAGPRAVAAAAVDRRWRCPACPWEARWQHWFRTSRTSTASRCTRRSSASTRMIAQHLGRWGPSVYDTVDLLGSETVAAIASAVDHTAVEPTAPPQGRLIVGAWHDRMAMREPAQALHERWGGELFWHKGSHVGPSLRPGSAGAPRRDSSRRCR